MGKERFKAEFTDERGAKVTIIVDGQLFEDSLERFVSIIRDIRKSPDKSWSQEGEKYGPRALIHADKESNSETIYGTRSQIHARSKINDVLVLIRTLPDDWFTSVELRRLYEQRFGTGISLSMISTYLSRLADKGYLNRIKTGRGFKYKIRNDSIKTQVQ